MEDFKATEIPDEAQAKPRVINLGIQNFYDALERQGVKCVQIQWTPPCQQDAEIEELLDLYL